jgi:hypothetical protein
MDVVTFNQALQQHSMCYVDSRTFSSTAAFHNGELPASVLSSCNRTLERSSEQSLTSPGQIVAETGSSAPQCWANPPAFDGRIGILSAVTAVPSDLQSRITSTAPAQAHARHPAKSLPNDRPVLAALECEVAALGMIPSPDGFGIALRMLLRSAARSPEPRGRRRGIGCASGLSRTVGKSSSGSTSPLPSSRPGLSPGGSDSEGKPNELRADADRGVAVVLPLLRERRRTETCASICSTACGDWETVRLRSTRPRGLGLRGLGLRDSCRWEIPLRVCPRRNSPPDRSEADRH